MLGDVNANTEYGCRILQVVCSHFVATPPVMGLRLTSARISLTQGFFAQRAILTFNDDIDIVLDPVYSVCVLDWWHPRYPDPPGTTPRLTPAQD